ncbi:MAG: Uma2 family endonuclease [Bacteroidia bacterium]|nr:Uma2 family endonuclease [Bacteroidia bacterium]
MYSDQLFPLVLDFSAVGGLTDDQLLAFARANDPYRVERTAHGEILIMAPTGTHASELENTFLYWLTAWNERYKLGRVTPMTGGFVLADGSMRAPDAAWIENGRYQQALAQQPTGFFRIAPDFVAEIVSPSDNLKELHSKLAEWIGNGVRLGWLIDPTTETAWVYQPGTEPTTITGFDATLAGEPVLPGFVFELAKLR